MKRIRLGTGILVILLCITINVNAATIIHSFTSYDVSGTLSDNEFTSDWVRIDVYVDTDYIEFVGGQQQVKECESRVTIGGLGTYYNSDGVQMGVPDYPYGSLGMTGGGGHPSYTATVIPADESMFLDLTIEMTITEGTYTLGWYSWPYWRLVGGGKLHWTHVSDENFLYTSTLVPIPHTMLLLATGLAVLSAFRMKFRRTV